MLGELRVYTGTEDHCVPSNATLYLSEGEPTSISDVKGNTIADPVTITTTCDDNDVVCVDKMPNKQCASWQRFIFDDPIALQQGAKYTFALEVEPSHYNLHPVMGVSPEAENHGGISSLAISSMYKVLQPQQYHKLLPCVLARVCVFLCLSVDLCACVCLQTYVCICVCEWFGATVVDTALLPFPSLSLRISAPPHFC